MPLTPNSRARAFELLSQCWRELKAQYSAGAIEWGVRQPKLWGEVDTAKCFMGAALDHGNIASFHAALVTFKAAMLKVISEFNNVGFARGEATPDSAHVKNGSTASVENRTEERGVHPSAGTVGAITSERSDQKATLL